MRFKQIDNKPEKSNHMDEDQQTLFDKIVTHLHLPLSYYHGMKILTLKLRTQWTVFSLRPKSLSGLCFLTL